jgi:glycosyltransferase involved in cell wall biosynthesis
MAYGLVVLATPTASIPDMIDDRVDGLIVPPDPQAIADTLEQLLCSKEGFVTISSAAIQKYQRAYTLEAHLNAIIPCILGNKDF